MTKQQIDSFLSAFPSAKRDESMVLHTYLKIGGPAALFLVTTSSEDFLRVIETAKSLGIPWHVIGGGSNLLVSDEGVDGLVIQAADRSVKIDGTTVSAGPGVFTGLLAKQTADAGLTGFEWGAGVPGMMGGATYGNAGCFGGEMKDAVSSVEAYNVATGSVVTYSNADCRFGYRDSRFKHEPYVILKTTLSLKSGDPVECKRRLDEIMAKRKDTQPQGAFSAGCLFKNFEYEDDYLIDKLKKHYEVPPEMLSKKRIAAGWLIDQLGLKGKTIGQAQVSPVHGNFLVNLGAAKAQDVIALSSLVKMKVRDELGILLEDEVQLLGF